MGNAASYYRPLSFPSSRISRIGHFLLILMMLPMLLPMALYGMVFGSYRRALRHAAVARKHAESGGAV